MGQLCSCYKVSNQCQRKSARICFWSWIFCESMALPYSYKISNLWQLYCRLFSVFIDIKDYNSHHVSCSGELLPADMRSFGCALLGIIDNISLFISVKFVPTIIASLGGYFWHGSPMSKSLYIFCKVCPHCYIQTLNFTVAFNWRGYWSLVWSSKHWCPSTGDIFFLRT